MIYDLSVTQLNEVILKVTHRIIIRMILKSSV